ncbi:SRPBCC family protein [Lentzea cavernae]|uniref:Cyclase n=1 Tax=Lentzea cavernae TaxID=2020703 RepID=A0ABQ3MEM0_9PSEU|nr:SRPBCC family protein [Lentzea cavernae]GHH38666.1 cyclase [Lentzea cavernae]
MSTITKSVDVEADVTSVYNQWTQFTEFPRFMEGVDRIEQLDDTHTRWTVSIAGVSRGFDATITEQHPDQRVAWRSDTGPEHAGVVTVHRLDDAHTRVTVQMDIDPEGFVENVADKLGILDRRVQGDLDRFKTYIEQRDGAETGAWRGDVDRPAQNGSGNGQV